MKNNMKNLFSIVTLLALSLVLSGCNTTPNQPASKKISELDHDIAEKIKLAEQRTRNRPDLTDDRITSAIPKVEFYDNVWDEMKQEFNLAHLYYGQYDKYLTFYLKRQNHIEKVSERAQPYLYYIFNEIKKRDMPYEIAILPIIESGFRSHARSHQRAVGLWQFIPSTAEIFNLDRNWWYDGRKDVVKSTQAALDFLQDMHKRNNNDWLLALASYNAGIGNVYKAKKRYRKKHKNQPGIKDYKPTYWDIQRYLPKETQAYVPKLLAVSHIIEHSDLFKVDLVPVDNQAYFTQVHIDQQIALYQVAFASNVDAHTIKDLNPAYRRFATPPKGPHHILLPVDRAERLKSALKENNEFFKISWKKHKIKSGDSLSVIAKRYKTSSSAIRKLNSLKNSRIRAGKTLLIPVPAVPSQTALASLSKTKNTGSTELYGKTYTVKADDTIWKISRSTKIKQKDLFAWNKLSKNKAIKPGQKLALYPPSGATKTAHAQKVKTAKVAAAPKTQNTKKAKVSKPSNPKKTTALTKSETPKKPDTKLANKTNPGSQSSKKATTAKNAESEALVKLTKIEHTLQRGETLWGLARKYKTSRKHIARWNNIYENKPLKAGMVLTIWKSDSTTVTSTKKETKTAAIKAESKKTAGNSKYVVRQGDSLWGIAKANKTTAKKLALFNKISIKTLLNPGQVINIPQDS